MSENGDGRKSESPREESAKSIGESEGTEQVQNVDNASTVQGDGEANTAPASEGGEAQQQQSGTRKMRTSIGFRIHTEFRSYMVCFYFLNCFVRIFSHLSEQIEVHKISYVCLES